MAVSIEVCNLALGEVRADFITAIDDNTPEARACARFYPMCLEGLLQLHEWSFAGREAELAALAVNDRPTEYDYAYALPSDLGVPRRMVVANILPTVGLYYPHGFPFWNSYVIEGTTLYTNASSATLEYGRKWLEPGEMPMLFKKALSLDLASYLATYLRDDSRVKGELIQQAEVAKQRAMAADLNRQPRNEYADRWPFRRAC
jgi:hypothetical protein